MDVIGKITVALPEVSGVAAASGRPWKKREYVLETQESFPKRIFFDFFNERADQYPLQVGQVIRLYFEIDSREYNGRWFVSVRGLRAEDPNAAPAQPYGAPAQQPYAAPAQQPYAAPAQPSVAPYPGAAPAPAQYGAQGGAVPPPPVPASDPSDDLPF